MYFRFIPVYRLQPVYIVAMGCKWVYLSVYGLYLQYSLRYVRCGLHIGFGYAVFQSLRVVGCFFGYMGMGIHTQPPLNRDRKIWAAFPKIFFLKFYFFIFLFFQWESFRLLLAFFV